MRLGGDMAALARRLVERFGIANAMGRDGPVRPLLRGQAYEGLLAVDCPVGLRRSDWSWMEQISLLP